MTSKLGNQKTIKLSNQVITQLTNKVLVLLFAFWLENKMSCIASVLFVKN